MTQQGETKLVMLGSGGAGRHFINTTIVDSTGNPSRLIFEMAPMREPPVEETKPPAEKKKKKPARKRKNKNRR